MSNNATEPSCEVSYPHTDRVDSPRPPTRNGNYPPYYKPHFSMSSV